MTNREKGNEFQRWIKKWLEERDYIARNFPTISKKIRVRDKKTGQIKEIWVSVQQDFMGADIVARQYDPVVDKSRQYYIQASLDGHVEKRVQEFKKYFKGLMDGEGLQVWIKIKPGLINIKLIEIHQNSFSVCDGGKIIRGKFYKSEEKRIHAH